MTDKVKRVNRSRYRSRGHYETQTRQVASRDEHRQNCGACGRFVKSRPPRDYRAAAMSRARVIPRVIMYTGSSQRRNPERIARRDLDDGRLQEGEERSFPAEISLVSPTPAPSPSPGRFSIPQIVNNTSPSSREISRPGFALPCEYSRTARGVSETPFTRVRSPLPSPWIYYSIGANVI